MTEEELKALIERVESLEKGLKEKDEKIATLENQNKELMGKVAGLKVDGLVAKVEETKQPVEPEEITFDFDM